MLRLSILLAAAATVVPIAAAASPNCAGAGEVLLSWPASDPLWEMCVLRPSDSSGTDGSGLELRDVHFRGVQVFKRAHTPILNVDYDSGTCFRDWLYSENPFEMILAQQPCSGVCEVSEPARTVCDVATDPVNPVGDCSSWSSSASLCRTGVAVHRTAGTLTLTSHGQAGWYRYSYRWRFHTDGTIEPEFGFGTYSDTFSDSTHRHHVYWRFDFDIAGPDGDVVSEGATPFTSEVSRQWSDPDGTDGPWRVVDQATGLGYELSPGAQDLQLPVWRDLDGDPDLELDPFARTDMLATVYRPSELDDGSFGCEIAPSVLVNGESLVGQDVVLWYRGGVEDVRDWSDPSGTDIFLCKKARPSLKTIGDWEAFGEVFADGFESGDATAWSSASP